ncbi:MAG: MXAN_5187 C-terminal domain-containing protein [Polyangiales bacterium]
MKNDEYEQLLKDTETMTSRLHAVYEQWFQGIERHEPQNMRKEVERRLGILRREMPRNNTMLRFRAQQLFQRYVSLSHYWGKVARQIEEGTYKRHVLRAKKMLEKSRGATKPKEKPDAWEIDVDVDLDADDMFGDADVDQLLAGFEKVSERLAPPSLAGRSTASDPTDASRAAGVFSKPKEAGGVFSKPKEAPDKVVPVSNPFADAVTVPQKAPPPPPPPSGLFRPDLPPAPPSGLIRPDATMEPPKPPTGMPRAPLPPRPLAGAPAAPPSRSASAQAAQAAQAALDERRMRAIYESYVDARRANNERTDNVKFETVAASLQKMLPELEQKHKGKKIDFEVVVKDGRVGLKPVAK